MASASLQHAISSIRSSFSYSSSFSSSSSYSLNTITSMVTLTKSPVKDRRIHRNLRTRAMVQQAVQGSPAAYAKEMERLSAKESLLLAFKDAGGFEALVTGKTTDMQQIDVNERIISLERLNPSPRPTTSPFLEGRWNFEWFGSGSPGLFAVKFIFQRFPSTLANVSKMDVLIKDAKANATANFKLLNLLESRFILSANLTVEGSLRMKEEYVEGILESPTVIEETVPEQLKGAFSQAVTTMQQLPVPIRDAVARGLRVPLKASFVSSIMALIGCPKLPFIVKYLSARLGKLQRSYYVWLEFPFGCDRAADFVPQLEQKCGAFQRLFMISYLDEEILIIRDTTGMPEVLTRLDVPSSSLAESLTEYES